MLRVTSLGRGAFRRGPPLIAANVSHARPLWSPDGRVLALSTLLARQLGRVRCELAAPGPLRSRTGR